MIVPSQWVLPPHGPALIGGPEGVPGLLQPPGTVGLSLVTHCRSCGRPDRRFFQSISRTPLHSVQGSPLPPQLQRWRRIRGRCRRC